jgi:hypothetical protein
MDGLHRRYEIGKPATHQTHSFFVPAAHPLEIASPATVKGAKEKRAIWIVHGMGEQVPFETVDSLAEGILSVGSNVGAGAAKVVGPPRFTDTKFAAPSDPSKTQVVQRVEIDIRRSDGTPLELHLYEAYWAPVTEGVPKVSDVVSFFFRGGLRGLMNCRGFSRAMFPDNAAAIAKGESGNDPVKTGQGFWKFTIPKRAIVEIGLVLAVLGALIVINGIITAASAEHLKLISFGTWYSPTSWNELTALASGIAALLISFGSILFLSVLTKPGKLPRPGKWLVKVVGWLALLADVLLVVLVALWMALLYLVPLYLPRFAAKIHVGHWAATQFVSTAGILAAALICFIGARYRAAHPHARHIPTTEGFLVSLLVLTFVVYLATLSGLFVAWFYGFTFVVEASVGSQGTWTQEVIKFLSSPYWVWPALLALSKYVRELMVEYPGDVAVYVDSNKVDRFDEVRQKIKQIALDSLMPLYSASTDGANSPLLYSKVAVIGHSLGSVIAYDTLNKLMILDGLLADQFHVAERTCVLETFGSPLDKVAFFFNILGEGTYDIREQLAASVQPLIQNYAKFRCFPWINVYSTSDIICGPMTFYDVPGTATPPHVQDVKDPDSVVPLIAHVEYWKNPTLWKLLFAEVTR